MVGHGQYHGLTVLQTSLWTQMGEVWTVTFRASFSSNPSQNAGLCGLFSSQVAVEGFVCWHNTSDASQSWENFWGGVEAVPHFHKEELISRGGGEWRWEISIPCVHLHLHCPVSPKEWPALSLKPSCTQHSRGSSVGWVQLPHPSVLSSLSPYPGRQPELPILLGFSALTSLSN